MAYESNFDKKQRRDAERRQTRARRWRANGRLIGLILVMLVALLVLGVVLARAPKEPQTEATTIPTTMPTTTQPQEPTQPQNPIDEIQLVFGGDLVINDAVVQAGALENGYDYAPIFRDVMPILAAANASGINLEGNIIGEPYGSASGSAPVEMMQALANAGVDLIQLSNSYTVTNGILGLSATVQNIQKSGMTPVGAYADKEQAQQEQGFTLCNIGGLRVAMVGYTKGFDGLSLPQNSQWCVNLLYTDYATTYQKVAESAILETLKNIQGQQPDLTVALVHWGSSYNNIISTSQKKIEELMLKNGVDAIIGTHSHYVQQVKYDQEAGTVVAYSLGDFFSGGEKSGSQYSILLQLQVTRNNLTGETKITGCDYVPIYTLTPERDGEQMRVVRIETAMEMYESSHIHRVEEQAYKNMKSALSKIRSAVGF